MAALRYTGASDAAVTIDGARRALKELDVTTNYFDVLGVQPFLGRTFLTEDEDIGDAPSVVLSYRTWQNLFASDAAIVGARVPLPGGRGYRVVGILPPGVDYPAGVDLYVPALALGSRGNEQIFESDVVARLAPDAAIEDARAQLRTIRARLTEEDSPAVWGHGDRHHATSRDHRWGRAPRSVALLRRGRRCAPHCGPLTSRVFYLSAERSAIASLRFA